ncbi:MAG: cyclic nucleotide-binding domain-containing protein [bacterium]
MKTTELLSKTDIFDGLSDEDLEKIAAGCIERDYPIGTVIIEENEPPKEMLFIVKEGEIMVTTGQPEKTSDETDSLLSTFGPGEAFGEVSLLDYHPHSATVRALSDTKLILLPASNLFAIIEGDKNIGYVVMKNLATMVCGRLRSSNFAIKHFGYWGKPEEFKEQ